MLDRAKTAPVFSQWSLSGQGLQMLGGGITFVPVESVLWMLFV